ncbi:hypothetical protein BG000_007727 [Podila horticola]|nr:hypothetical protein BG000_007727 [Podila horticola]
MEDWWNIANFCKDALDAHIRKKRNIFKVAGLQVFGLKVSLWTMTYKDGIYHFTRTMVAHIPADQHDIARAPRCLELMGTLGKFLDPIMIVDNQASEETGIVDPGRKSNLTPKVRSMF